MPTGLDLVRMPGFEWPANAKLDFEPLNKALSRAAVLELQRDQLGLERDRFGLQREQLGLDRRRVDLQAEQLRHSRDLEQRRFQLDLERRNAEALANRSLLLRRISDPARRGQEIQRLTEAPGVTALLQQHGYADEHGRVRPEHHDSILDLLIARGRDPLAALQAEENIALTRQRAEDLLYDRFLNVFGQGPPREEDWVRESGPGGILRTMFPAGPPPFSSAPEIIRQVQARRGRSTIQNMSDEEIRAIFPDITDQGIQELRRSELMRGITGRSTFGQMPTGHRLVFRNGRWVAERVPGVDPDPRNPVPVPMLRLMANTLDEVFTALAGTVRQDGSLDTSQAIPLAERTAGWMGTSIGGRVSPRATEAFQAAQHVVTTLSYALSGRQMANAEQLRLLEQFTPRPGESHEISAFKLNFVREMLRGALQARGDVATPQERAEFVSALTRNHRRLMRMIAESGQRRSGQQPPTSRRPSGEWKIEPLEDGVP